MFFVKHLGLLKNCALEMMIIVIICYTLFLYHFCFYCFCPFFIYIYIQIRSMVPAYNYFLSYILSFFTGTASVEMGDYSKVCVWCLYICRLCFVFLSGLILSVSGTWWKTLFIRGKTTLSETAPWGGTSSVGSASEAKIWNRTRPSVCAESVNKGVN